MSSLRTILNKPESTAHATSTSSHHHTGFAWNNNGYYYLPLLSTTYLKDQPGCGELSFLPHHLGSSSLYDSSTLHGGSNGQTAMMYSGNTLGGQSVTNWRCRESFCIPSLLKSFPISHNSPHPEQDTASHEWAAFGCFQPRTTPELQVRLLSFLNLFH